MVIKNRVFEELPGTVFVVYLPEVGMALAVFKTKAAADAYRDRAKGSEVRVGHFLANGDIETI